MEVRWIWWTILICSAILLLLVLFRRRIRLRWFGFAALQLVVAAVALYVLDGIPALQRFQLPINPATIFTVGILGLPGFALLIAVKVAFF